MKSILTDRMAAEIEGDFVIYTNGMRLNELRAVHGWFLAGRKLTETFDRLEADPNRDSSAISRRLWDYAVEQPPVLAVCESRRRVPRGHCS